MGQIPVGVVEEDEQPEAEILAEAVYALSESTRNQRCAATGPYYSLGADSMSSSSLGSYQRPPTQTPHIQDTQCAACLEAKIERIKERRQTRRGSARVSRGEKETRILVWSRGLEVPWDKTRMSWGRQRTLGMMMVKGKKR